MTEKINHNVDRVNMFTPQIEILMLSTSSRAQDNIRHFRFSTGGSSHGAHSFTLFSPIPFQSALGALCSRPQPLALLVSYFSGFRIVWSSALVCVSCVLCLVRLVGTFPFTCILFSRPRFLRPAFMRLLRFAFFSVLRSYVPVSCVPVSLSCTFFCVTAF